MNKCLSRLYSAFLLLLIFSFGNTADASHFYGTDLSYTWISGNTYKITLTVYGNCAGSAFPSLFSGVPTVITYDGATPMHTLTLLSEGPPVEVSPVCPAQMNMTACTIPTSTIPGVMRFVFSTTYTLPGISANYRFRFNGTSVNAGRSNNISNITPVGSVTALEATLNNTLGPNSSPVYTTIPTPFMCVSKPYNYNPGTVDADGDALSYFLVPGLISTGGTVSYVPPFSATNPLPAVPTTFNYNGTNGQLSFTPSSTMFSLVVSQVNEYRGGTLVGTSMREMTFVILACNNNPPGGSISNPSSGATVINNTSIRVCKETGPFSFHINPTDADGNAIDVTVAGLPAGATFNTTNNNTVAPQSILNWDVSNVTPGTYTFFVTYTDDGCPLVSKQTVAYTILVLPNPALRFNLISPALCNKKAVFTLTPVDANSPYTITFGSTARSGVTGMITDSLDPGTYTFTVTATNGCSHDTSITLQSPATTQVAALVKQNTCNGTTDGAVTLSAWNSTAPYTYAMNSGPYSGNGNFGGLAAGSYAFHVKDLNGCLKDTTIIIGDSLKVYGNIIVTDVLCYNNNTGSIQVSGRGGINPYQYALGNGSFSGIGNFPALTAGTYAVHVKDMLGCYKDTNAIVVQPTAPLDVTAVVTDVFCNGAVTGSVVLSGTGGTPAYTYAIGTGTYTASNSFTGLAAGTYTFHIRDNNACQKDTTITIIQPAPLAFTLALTNVLCNGASTGTVTVNATGGTPAYTYAADANPFGAANLLTVLNAGAHIIHLKDANGCTKDSTITLTQPAALNISYAAVHPLCNGSANGTITISGSGGTTPYTYALNANPFVSSGAMTGLTAGTYAVHIKDANGCTKDTVCTLTDPPALTVTAAIKRPRCTPLVNGSVTLTAGGGTPVYTYATGSSPYQASPTLTGLGSGTYTFHVKDAHGCIKDTTITITDSVFVHATTAISHVKCFGGSDGSINITPYGGDAPYQYALNTNPYAATNPIINLLPGTFTLHVKDANGCILDTAQTITQPTIIVPAVTVAQPLCYQGTDGNLAVAVTGGTPGYTYALGTGSYGTTPGFTGLTAGTYTIHVKDANNCVHDTTVTMGQPTPLRYTFLTLTHLTCHNDSSGKVTVYAQGATPPYTYAADANVYQASNILTGLKAGTRPIHLKDNNGCQLDTIVQLYEPTKVYVRVDSMITPTCEGYKDGSVKISADGGIPGYTFSPDNVTFGATRYYPGLQEGTYTFYAKDSRGCPADTTFDLTGYPHIVIHNPLITDASCNGFSDGKFTLVVTGGNKPLSYFMKNPASSNYTGQFDSLKMGVYAVHIVDSTGCVKDTSVRINQPDSLIAATVITPNDCSGYDDGGAVTVNPTGGTTPYTYLWSTAPAQTSDRITGLPNGKYAVVVTDAHHCRDTAIALVPYDNCCKPILPDAFTPNGDGRNDRFRVLFKGDASLVEFSVYNRYGQRVFYTTAINAGWDGTWNDVNQDVGTYFYYIKLICGNKGDKVQEYKGDVTLIR